MSASFYEATENLEEVAHLQSGDYSWCEVGVWSDGKQFFWATDSGCSCSYFGENLTADDLKILDSVQSAAFREAVDSGYDMSEQEKQEFTAKVRDAMSKVKR